MRFKIVLVVILSFFLQKSVAQKRTDSQNQDEELGKVSWYRDYKTAIKLSEKENKPILILFQEVPGCSTCRNYGHNVLSHPLMTEAIENEFIPLAIFNNKKGKDLEIVKKYNEPTWNNPVVRIVNAKGENIVNRLASDYSSIGLYNSMINALDSVGTSIPEYFKILGMELPTSGRAHNLEESYFKMYCFWTGEKELGAQDGVLATKAGFMENAEVVRVVYDADKISSKELEGFAKKHKMTSVNHKKDFVWAQNDEDYFIQHSDFKYLPLSEVQKTKINSALGNKKSAIQFLSPKQEIWLEAFSKSNNKVLFDKDFFDSWEQLSSL
jgi:hypothetical protein